MIEPPTAKELSTGLCVPPRHIQCALDAVVNQKTFPKADERVSWPTALAGLLVAHICPLISARTASSENLHNIVVCCLPTINELLDGNSDNPLQFRVGIVDYVYFTWPGSKCYYDLVNRKEIAELSNRPITTVSVDMAALLSSSVKLLKSLRYDNDANKSATSEVREAKEDLERSGLLRD